LALASFNNAALAVNLAKDRDVPIEPAKEGSSRISG